jgi:hypothetical protein
MEERIDSLELASQGDDAVSEELERGLTLLFSGWLIGLVYYSRSENGS